MSGILEEIKKNELENMLSPYQHPPYILELELAKWMLEADREKSHELLSKINSLERAYLSESPLCSLQYSLIAGCTCYTRTAIRAGVDSERAFNMSDFYIQEIGKSKSIAALNALEYTMLDSFIDLIQGVKDQKTSTNPIVNQIILYIHANINRHITLGDIASEVHLHPNYVSMLFRKEVDCSISDFIAANKVLAIEKFLIETDLKMLDIAEAFEFSSAAHFSGFFKKYTGMTPRAYRSTHAKGPAG